MRCGEDGRNGGGASRCLPALQVVLQNHGNGASLWCLWWLPVSARCRHVSRFDGGRWWRRRCCRLVVVGEEMAAAAAMVMEGEEKIRVRVSFWEIVTWQNLIGQFGEWRIMTHVSLWLA